MGAVKMERNMDETEILLQEYERDRTRGGDLEGVEEENTE